MSKDETKSETVGKVTEKEPKDAGEQFRGTQDSKTIKEGVQNSSDGIKAGSDRDPQKPAADANADAMNATKGRNPVEEREVAPGPSRFYNPDVDLAAMQERQRQAQAPNFQRHNEGEPRTEQEAAALHNPATELRADIHPEANKVQQVQKEKGESDDKYTVQNQTQKKK
jgi:hypothetical protein